MDYILSPIELMLKDAVSAKRLASCRMTRADHVSEEDAPSIKDPRYFEPSVVTIVEEFELECCEAMTDYLI